MDFQELRLHVLGLLLRGCQVVILPESYPELVAVRELRVHFPVDSIATKVRISCLESADLDLLDMLWVLVHT